MITSFIIYRVQTVKFSSRTFFASYTTKLVNNSGNELIGEEQLEINYTVSCVAPWNNYDLKSVDSFSNQGRLKQFK